jgi:hypothetical protein
MKDIELTAKATLNLRSKYQEDPNTGCWEWTGATGPGGYGRVRTAGKAVFAHRYSAKLHGQEVEGWVVRHSCDNPGCVNPEHLETGTPSDNTQDMIKRGRSTGPGLKGEDHIKAKLTETDVIYIRKSEESSHILSKRFRVCVDSINNVRARRTWAHI